MKNIIKYIASTLFALAVVGCSQDNFETSGEIPEGQGKVSLNMSFGETKAVLSSEETATIMESSTLRIYKNIGSDEEPQFENGGLIQKYSPASTMPENLYLTVGKYLVTLEAGNNAAASADPLNRTFYGKQEFEVQSQVAKAVNVNCSLLNSVVVVNFDQTILDKFDTSHDCYLSLSDEFSKDAIESVPTLHFTNSGTGYFLMPEGSTKISWGFYGVSTQNDLTVENNDGDTSFDEGALNVSKVDVIENVKAATKYTVNLAYIKTPDGQGYITVVVDESADIYEDFFEFSLQPSISSKGFDVSNDIVSYANQDLEYNIKSTNDIKRITISVGKSSSASEIVIPFDNGAVVAAEGAAYVGDTKEGTLTLSQPFFDKYGFGGQQDYRISVTDVNSVSGIADGKVKLNGMLNSVTSYNNWTNSATLSANVNEAEEGVKFQVRNSGQEDWNDVEASGSEGTYSANVAAVWEASTNDSKLTVYQQKFGFSPSATVECRLVVGEEVVRTSTFTLSADGKQSIPYGTMEDGGLHCFDKDSGSNWGSGNNTFASGLCSQATKDGSKVAYLKAGEPISGALGAGNLFLGTFSFKLTSQTGTVSFGQSFAWQARPKTFKFDYAAEVGTVNITKYSLPAGVSHPSGTQDQALVYFAIVDWGSRHQVKAGTSGAPSGCWDPSTQTTVGSSGKVIGYSWVIIDKSVSSMTSVEAPIYYYDTVTKPSNTYTMVVSCATSRYGDYMVGCSSNKMWVDNFTLGY